MWTLEEDDQLRAVVQQEGIGKWQEKSEAFTSRSSGALRHRWNTMSLENEKPPLATINAKPSAPWNLEQKEEPGSMVDETEEDQRNRQQMMTPTLLCRSAASPKDQNCAARGQRWSKDEAAKLTELVERDGPGQWAEKAAELGTSRTWSAVSQQWSNIERSSRGCADDQPSYRRSPWSLNEDDLLRKAVKKHGSASDISWTSVAAMVPGRPPKRCSERWYNHVDPSVSHAPWSAEENAQLLSLYQVYDGKWFEIAAKIPGRPDQAYVVPAMLDSAPARTRL